MAAPTGNNGVNGFSPLLFGDPTAQANLDQLQRQQQWAQTLLEQSQQSPQGQMVGDRYVKPSWTQGLSQLLKAYMGRQGVDEASKGIADVQSKAMAGLLAQMQPQQVAGPSTPGGALGTGTYGIDTPGQPQMRPSPMNPTGAPPQLAMAAFLGNPAAQAALKNYDFTEPSKMALQSGGNPVSANADALAKANTAPGVLEARQSGLTDEQIRLQALAKGNKEGYIAPVEVKANNLMLSPDGKTPMAFNPGSTPGVGMNFGMVNGMVQPTSAAPVSGFSGANAAIAGAEQGAKQRNTILTNVEGPGNVKLTGWGGTLAGGGGGGSVASNQSPAAPGINPPAGALQPNFRGTSSADPLQQKTKEQQISLMSDDFKNQFQRSSNAQGTINNLQQIMGYAQGARTGQQSDKLRLVDSVLSMMGSQDATQRQIAGDLLGKNANQIVARLGNGDMGTDAARQILISAYPNAKMMSQAIEEAAQNLIAQQHLVRSRTQVLSPKYNGGDFQGYNQAAQQFDALADPRIFQWKAMPDGPAKDAYRAQITKQDPSLMQKAKALADLGVQ